MDDSSKFDRWFIAGFAVFLAVCGLGYIAAITFATIPEKNVRFADTALGFILGTLLTTVVAYFYGNSKQNQTVTAAAIAPVPPTPSAPVRVDDSTPIKVEDVK